MKKQSVNNFEIIRTLLSWEEEGDYYYVQLILRKKDGATTFGNKNNSARIIKTYCFFNIEQFDSKETEIIELCELFGCRAGINLNKRNEKQVAHELLCNLSDRIRSGNFKGINGILNTSNGSAHSRDKYWLVDVDGDMPSVSEISILIESCQPHGKQKIIAFLPTYNGIHFVTNRFDRNQFNKLTDGKVDIHKNNPFALYYPSREV